MVDMPEEWKAGIDVARFGQHIAQQEQGAFTPYGYLVKSGDEWQRVHEGQPVPEEYRVMGFPQPEVLREAVQTRQAAAPHRRGPGPATGDPHYLEQQEQRRPHERDYRQAGNRHHGFV